MKTRTNLRKAAVRTAAVVVSFVLVSYTVSAQEFWKKLLTNSSFNEIAIAMVEPGNMEPSGDSSNSPSAEWKNFDLAFDPALELEGWMSSEEHFKVNASHDEEQKDVFSSADACLPGLDYSADASDPLKLEDWMVHDSLWIN